MCAPPWFSSATSERWTFSFSHILCGQYKRNFGCSQKCQNIPQNQNQPNDLIIHLISNREFHSHSARDTREWAHDSKRNKRNSKNFVRDKIIKKTHLRHWYRAKIELRDSKMRDLFCFWKMFARWRLQLHRSFRSLSNSIEEIIINKCDCRRTHLIRTQNNWVVFLHKLLHCFWRFSRLMFVSATTAVDSLSIEASRFIHSVYFSLLFIAHSFALVCYLCHFISESLRLKIMISYIPQYLFFLLAHCCFSLFFASLFLSRSASPRFGWCIGPTVDVSHDEFCNTRISIYRLFDKNTRHHNKYGKTERRWEEQRRKKKCFIY